jgi:hypothetical protein
LRSSCKLSGDLEFSNAGIDSRQGAKYAKFGIEILIILQTILFIFSDLCGLGVFAGDIPSFGCGFAALGAYLREDKPWFQIILLSLDHSIFAH